MVPISDWVPITDVPALSALSVVLLCVCVCVKTLFASLCLQSFFAMDGTDLLDDRPLRRPDSIHRRGQSRQDEIKREGGGQREAKVGGENDAKENTKKIYTRRGNVAHKRNNKTTKK